MSVPPDVVPETVDAFDSALGVLLSVSGAESVSLWSRSGSSAAPLRTRGAVERTVEDLRDAASAALHGETAVAADLTVMVLAVGPDLSFVLIAHDPTRPANAHAGLLRAARPALTALLARAQEAAPSAGPAAELAAAERRLQRLRFDLHDGPQQELHLLGQDLRRFRSQLAPMIEAHPDRDRALGRLDDLEAQLQALDTDLRRLATAAASPLLAGSLAQTLVQVAEAFTVRTGIVPRTEIAGDVESLTASQRIALVSLVREALTNVRQHAEATSVQIVIRGSADAVAVEVGDDGEGFDPARTAPRAAADGHLGLVGMRERMRMLGGHTEIRSRPGGPTIVTATLPRWPVEPGGDTGAASTS